MQYFDAIKYLFYNRTSKLSCLVMTLQFKKIMLKFSDYCQLPNFTQSNIIALKLKVRRLS